MNFVFEFIDTGCVVRNLGMSFVIFFKELIIEQTQMIMERNMVRNGLVSILAACMITGATGCSSIKNTWDSMSQSGQGATAGGAIGAAVGTGVGAIIGGGRGTWIGALVGSAIGAGTGALVGNSMDRQQKALQQQLDQLNARADNADAREDSLQKQIEQLKVERVKDSNNLDALKLVMGNSVLFATGKSMLSPEAQAVLSKVAYNLDQFPDTDVTVVGYTDNTGSEAVNDRLSNERAQTVVNYLENHGVAAARLKAVGRGWNDPVTSNATAAGRAQNRRVEIYITASKQMIEQDSNR